MTTEDDLTHLRTENAALQRQVRLLLEQMAEAKTEPPSERFAPPSTPEMLAALTAENGRLVDQVRNLSRELGACQERLRQLEGTQPSQAPDAKTTDLARALRVLLRALQDDM
jgi:chromosome segregation ATPase